MTILMQSIGIWITSFMLFHVNKLNDPLNPESRMNHYHPVNCSLRKTLIEELKCEGNCCDGKRDVIIEWQEIWPWLCPTMITVLSMMVIYLLQCLTR